MRAIGYARLAPEEPNQEVLVELSIAAVTLASPVGVVVLNVPKPPR